MKSNFVYPLKQFDGHFVSLTVDFNFTFNSATSTSTRNYSQ